ncbi:ComEA family DNA-binding protein [Moraxella atlantae]|uniref:ComEA family DNA-binding protein n=1 Tax=Faucicola atlantae TaxID=34059 RepID=UPI00375377E1
MSNSKFLANSVLVMSLLHGFAPSALAADCAATLTPEQAFLQLRAPRGRQGAARTTALTADPLANVPPTINLNTASEAELVQLDGIGASKAQAIILYREQIAPFVSVDELARVKGIGKATVDKNRNRLSVR